MMKSALAALAFSASVILTATAAQAADPYVDPGYDWTGSYIGLFAGYGEGDIKLKDINGYNGGGGAGNFKYDADGFLGGINGGHNWQTGSLVVGLEGELGYFGYDGSGQFPAYVGVRLPTDSRASIDGGLYGGAFVRGGFAVNQVLFYGKLGAVGLDTKVSFIDTDPTGATLTGGTSASKFLVGLGAGAGLEFALGNNWSVGAEYLYMDFGSISHTATPGNFKFTHQLDGIHTGRATLKFKF
jgi:outer membrane immunogenic protein